MLECEKGPPIVALHVLECEKGPPIVALHVLEGPPIVACTCWNVKRVLL